MKKVLLVLLALAGTVQMNALFRHDGYYDQYGNYHEHHGIIGSTVRGVVHAGEDVVDVATSPVRGGYQEVRIERIDDRIDEIKRELRNKDLDTNTRENLKFELRSLRRERRDRMEKKNESRKEKKERRQEENRREDDRY